MKIKTLVISLAVAANFCGIAKGASLIKNGSFELSDYLPANQSYSITSPGVPADDHGKIKDWSVSGYGATSAFWNSIYVYDDLNPLTPPPPMPASYRSCAPSAGFQSGAQCANPDGAGHFLNLDGDPGFPAAVSQTISTGLVAGEKYQLTFSWAAVQRDDASGPTSDEYLTVALGSQTLLTTPNIFPGPPSLGCTTCLPSKGFSGWFTTSYDFVWNGSSDVLSFMAHGNPGGLPPSLDLDGVSLTSAPEPPSWILMITGIGLLVLISRRRRQMSAAK